MTTISTNGRPPSPVNIQVKLENSGKPWTPDQESRLTRLFEHGYPLIDICKKFGRSATGITERMKKLNLIDWRDTGTSVKADVAGLYDQRTNELYATYSTVQSINQQLKGETPSPAVEQVAKPSITTQENPMTVIINNEKAVTVVTIETAGKKEVKTFIFGVPAEQVSDDRVFGHISNIEAQIESLDKIKSQPKKLQAKIAGLRDDIKALSDLVDSRP